MRVIITLNFQKSIKNFSLSSKKSTITQNCLVLQLSPLSEPLKTVFHEQPQSFWQCSTALNFHNFFSMFIHFNSKLKLFNFQINDQDKKKKKKNFLKDSLAWNNNFSWGKVELFLIFFIHCFLVFFSILQESEKNLDFVWGTKRSKIKTKSTLILVHYENVSWYYRDNLYFWLITSNSRLSNYFTF